MIDRRLLLGAMAAGPFVAGLSGCASSASRNDTSLASSGWDDVEPPYVLFPGDEIDLALPSASEMNRSLVVGPDGRVSLPLAGHVMLAERSLAEAEGDISNAYAQYLVRPAVELSLRRSAPAKIWIDGQVRNPGAYDLTGEPVSAYQALLLAGGVTAGSKSRQAVLIRRGQNGQVHSHILDLRVRNLAAPRARRGDIIFVPRNGLGEIAAFMTQLREAMPVGFSYALNGRWN